MNGQEKDSISQYLELVKQRPELFVQSKALPLVLDEEELRVFSLETGKRIGLVHDQSPFWLVLVDLCSGSNGFFSYGRVIYCNEKSNGTAAIIKRGDRFGMLKVFRHGIRGISIEIPRGFHEEKDLSQEENIAKELFEELGIEPKDCYIQKLGTVRPDAGLTSGCAHIFLVEIHDEIVIKTNGHEGIFPTIEWYTDTQLARSIRNGEITDGFTLSAYALYIASKQA